jgi:hypothetical protein
MVTSLYDVLQGVGDSSGTRGNSQTGYTTFEGCDAILKDALGRVGQTTIDITCIAETKTISSML